MRGPDEQHGCWASGSPVAVSGNRPIGSEHAKVTDTNPEVVETQVAGVPKLPREQQAI
jgi:hypothetical protein